MFATLAVAVALIAWAIWTYNRLIGLKNQVDNGWRQIDVQLKRRRDLIPNLVAAVRGYFQYEGDALERVIAARARAAAAPSVHDSSAAEADLSRALRQLLMVVENYPQLRANENVLQLQEELTTTENQLGFARQYYNDVVTRFNTQREVFPASLIASASGFNRAELFAADDEDRAAPSVDLSLRPNR
ncbi:MAG: LemA family protein [Candidatus Binatia bacterium]